MKYRQEIMDAFSSCPGLLVKRAYHSTLPPDISAWYCYLSDCGHSILCLPECLADEASATDNVQDFLAPVSVKTVLRGYRMREGYVVVDVEYDRLFGISTPDEDDEY